MAGIVALLEWARSSDGRALAGWGSIFLSAALLWWVEWHITQVEKRMESIEQQYVRAEIYVRDFDNLDDRFSNLDSRFDRLEESVNQTRLETVRTLERLQDTMTRFLERSAGKDPASAPHEGQRSRNLGTEPAEHLFRIQ